MIVIVAGDINKRFTSSHEYFLPKSHFGYVTMSEQAFSNIPQGVYDSMSTIAVMPETIFTWYLVVPVYLLGNA